MEELSSPSSPGVSPLQLSHCIEELLRFTLSSYVNETLEFDLGLSKEYCTDLLRDDHWDPNSDRSGEIINLILLEMLKAVEFELHVQEPFFSQLRGKSLDTDDSDSLLCDWPGAELEPEGLVNLLYPLSVKARGRGRGGRRRGRRAVNLDADFEPLLFRNAQEEIRYGEDFMEMNIEIERGVVLDDLRAFKEDLSYVEESVEILDQNDKVLQNQVVSLVKVLWKNHTSQDASWELESDMREKYPQFTRSCTQKSTALYSIDKYVSLSHLPSSIHTFALSLSSNLIPKNHIEALRLLGWKKAMNLERDALLSCHTWSLVDLPSGKELVKCRWVYTINYLSDGSVERLKARLVAKGYIQTYGVDYFETFPSGSRLNSVYMEQPPRRLLKGRIVLRFSQCYSDHSVFVRHRGGKLVILVVYVDDIIVYGDDVSGIAESQLHKFFWLVVVCILICSLFLPSPSFLHRRIGSGALLLFNKCLLLEVKDVRRYDSFSEMLELESLPKVLPGVNSIEEGVQIYRKFYTEEKAKSNGVLAICVTKPTSQPYISLAGIISGLSNDGIRSLLGLAHTVGSAPDALPPPRYALLSSFVMPHKLNVKGSTLTKGARALAKHVNRSGDGWWGNFDGNDANKNRLALEIISSFIAHCCWMNIHTVQPYGSAFEIRVAEGYGARWSKDGSKFIGFLEPYMDGGHSSGWKH
ncbi:uncharacterized protein LOC122647343 [Telopea speciosissima]|uniref:uncharacterized protein LOC122647343 n=1 Tax=Telopea speciosissima TaxID=54955 RepID=UPI001CC36A1B|nr:uncharacterized protein LOC122647343 [Telopea speciosissima]